MESSSFHLETLLPAGSGLPGNRRGPFLPNRARGAIMKHLACCTEYFVHEPSWRPVIPKSPDPRHTNSVRIDAIKYAIGISFCSINP